MMAKYNNPNDAEGDPQEPSVSSTSSLSGASSLQPPSTVSNALKRQAKDPPYYETVPRHELMLDHLSFNGNVNRHHERQREMKPPAEKSNESMPPPFEASDVRSSQNGTIQEIQPTAEQLNHQDGSLASISEHHQHLNAYNQSQHEVEHSEPFVPTKPSPANESNGHYHEEGKRQYPFNDIQQGADKVPVRKKKRRKRHTTNGKQQERWDQMFARLYEYRRIHGDCLVPNRYPEDPSLGSWVSTQRRHYKVFLKNDPEKTTPMTQERCARLESIGFQWTTRDPRHIPWETRFEQLLEYKREYGDCVVPTGFKDNPKLANWVSVQRQEYKLFKLGVRCNITKERVDALDSVGFVWKAQRGSSQQQKEKKKIRDAIYGAAAQQVAPLAAGVAEDPGCSSASLDDLATLAQVAHTSAATNNVRRELPPSTLDTTLIRDHPPSMAESLGRDLPPSIVSNVLAILDGQQQHSNQSQMLASEAAMAAQREAEANAVARRIEEIVAEQRRTVVNRGNGSSLDALLPRERAPLPSSILDPPQVSLRRDLMESRVGAEPTRSNDIADGVPTRDRLLDVPCDVEDAIMTKHLIEALRNDRLAIAMGVDVAVEKIKTTLVRAGRVHRAMAETFVQTRRDEVAMESSLLPLIHNPLPPPRSVIPTSLPPPPPPPIIAPRVAGSESEDSDATETDSESSTHGGAALQVGEIGKDEVSGLDTEVSTMNKRVVTRESLSVEPSLSEGLETKRSSLSTNVGGHDRLPEIRQMNGGSANGWSNSSNGVQSDRDDAVDDAGGVFSDAE